ncbi:MAG TPA: hypothetical protein PK604_13930, partial [Acetivibrio clariflavus]|nr:hypothetical protein [Acetivibrio clariflavus]
VIDHTIGKSRNIFQVNPYTFPINNKGALLANANSTLAVIFMIAKTYLNVNSEITVVAIFFKIKIRKCLRHRLISFLRSLCRTMVAVWVH